MTAKRNSKKRNQRRGVDAPPTPVSATVESTGLPDVASPTSPHPAASHSSPATPPASEHIDGVAEQSPVAEAGLATPPPGGSHDENADGEQGQSELDQQTEAAAEAEQHPSATGEDTHAEGSHDENAEPQHGDVPPDQEAQVTEPAQQAANSDVEQPPTNVEGGSLAGTTEHESREAEPAEPAIADSTELSAAVSQKDNEEDSQRTPIGSGNSEEQTQSEPLLDDLSDGVGMHVGDAPISGGDLPSSEGDDQIAVGEQSTEDCGAEDDQKAPSAPTDLECHQDELQHDELLDRARGQDGEPISKQETDELDAEQQAEVVGDDVQTPPLVSEPPEANNSDEGQPPAADDATRGDDLPTSGDESSITEANTEVVAGDQVDEVQEQVQTTEGMPGALDTGNQANVHESTEEEGQQELEDSQHEPHESDVNLTPVEPVLEDKEFADDGVGHTLEVDEPHEQIVAGEQDQADEAQILEDATQATAVEDSQKAEGTHGRDSATDAHQTDDEAQLDPVDTGDAQDSEETQEQSDNDQFFDTLEPEPDAEDFERTPTQLDQFSKVSQKSDHEQTEQFDALEYGDETDAAEHLEEEDATLYDSPSDPGAYALQIIIEQPEEEAIWSPQQEYEQYDHPSADSQDNSSKRDSFPYGEAYEGEVHDQETTEEMQRLRAGTIFDISAKDVASRDLLAVADLFANMKSALTTMTSAFDRLGAQTEKMAALGLDVKAAQQLQQIKATLQSQISRHTAEVETLKSSLQAKIKEAVEAKIRDRLQGVIQSSIRAAVEERVRAELSVQIPQDLRKQVISHKRQILEVKTSLHNSEARRYNALQTMPDLNAPLRPLLRPLPTPEQSPVVISISRSSSMGYSTLPTPATAFPQGPAPTPIRRSASNPYRSLTSETVPPSPSPFFPRDMTTLFALNPEETKRLLREYGLTSAVASPATEHPTRARGLSIVNEEAAEEDPDVHARDLNKFMAHIGVPFLMIPAPKEKHHESAPLSSKSRRRLLTPLIIK